MPTSGPRWRKIKHTHTHCISIYQTTRQCQLLLIQAITFRPQLRPSRLIFMATVLVFSSWYLAQKTSRFLIMPVSSPLGRRQFWAKERPEVLPGWHCLQPLCDWKETRCVIPPGTRTSKENSESPVIACDGMNSAKVIKELPSGWNMLSSWWQGLNHLSWMGKGSGVKYCAPVIVD